MTDEEQATWDLVFKKGANKAELLINYKNYEISRDKLHCMAPGTWLNDEAINMYMVLLQVCLTKGLMAGFKLLWERCFVGMVLGMRIARGKEGGIAAGQVTAEAQRCSGNGILWVLPLCRSSAAARCTSTLNDIA